jgi:hypothetical protein
LCRSALYLRHQIYHDRNRGYADDERCRVCASLTLALPEMNPPVPKKIGDDTVDRYSPFVTAGIQTN